MVRQSGDDDSDDSSEDDTDDIDVVEKYFTKRILQKAAQRSEGDHLDDFQRIVLDGDFNFVGEDDDIRHRDKRPRKDQNQSPWAQMLAAGLCRDPSCVEGILFRTRFRLPYPLFENILGMIEDEGWFTVSPVDCCGQETSRLDLKLLGALRVLGRGTCFDGIEELTNISIRVSALC